MFLCSDELFVVRTRKRVGAFKNLSRSSWAIFLRGGGTRSPGLPSGGMLAETPRQDARQSIAEHPGIRGAVAVEHARFIEQEMRGIPLEG